MTWNNLFILNMKLASLCFIIGGIQLVLCSIIDDLNPIYGTLAVLDFILAYLCYMWNPETGFEPKKKEVKKSD
jgi:uncharacterized membrane protein